MEQIVIHLADHDVTFSGRALTQELFALAADDDSYKKWDSRIGYTVYLTAEDKVTLVVTGADADQDAVELFDSVEDLAKAGINGMTPVPRSVYLAANSALVEGRPGEPES